MKPYLQQSEKVLEQTSSNKNGLTKIEASKRLEQNGKNKLIEQKKQSLISRFLQQLADPMIIILLAAALVSAVTASIEGESPAEVIIILAVVIVNAILGVYQESKAEAAIEALSEMAAATSKVLRDNQIETVKSEDLVLGDIILLEAGDAVPADARIIECASLKAEEAALTGESVPVTKQAETLSSNSDVSLGDRLNMVYMGSSIVYGRAKAVVTATGMATEMGKIADALATAKEGKTPLQIQLAKLSKILTALVLAVCAVIFAVGIIRGEHLLESFMVAVSLAVAAIPEGLVAVVTIVLSIGVTNMSRRNAIIRKLTAVETLGCAQIICSDKTGTLTQNKMTVVKTATDNEHLCAKAMALCSDAVINNEGIPIGEPTECALVVWAETLGIKKQDLNLAAPRINEAPFDSQRKMMSTIHNENGSIIQYTKGAPDEVLKLCTHYQKNGKTLPLTDKAKQDILKENASLAAQALRILACATRTHDHPPMSADPKTLEQNLCFIGLTGMIDPVRPEVKDAIEKCKQAGIQPIMITGDHADTAAAIANELGILNQSSAITGSQLEQMSDEEYNKNFKNYSVYARVQPEHKVRIVNAWRSAGYITAMTGDGVNDAPSIKSADIGVGMGITGTDVTKNVADMVLTDDNFATIVGAVEEGRRIYDNIKKVIQFLLSSNMSEVISIFVATLLGFIILRPAHLLWINLVTDCFPALALGLEHAEPDIMKRKPRQKTESIFAGGVGSAIAYQGLMVATLTLVAYFIGHYIESGIWEIANSPDGTTMAFLTMSMAEICHSFNMRSQTKSIFTLKSSNKSLIYGALISLIGTTMVIYVPFLSNAFGFTHINAAEYAISIALAISVIPIVELVKLIKRKASKT